MPTMIPEFWLFVVAILAIAIFLDGHRRRSRVSYPPGPKPRFLVGNLFDIPSSKPWKVYHDWAKVYGDLFHFEINGQHTVVVNSQKLADAMFEKRSRIYSDRPLIPMVEVTGWMKLNTGLMRYGQDWRVHRRLYKYGFRANIVPNYQPILHSKVGQFLQNLQQSPTSFLDHARTYTAATILATVYGYDIAPTNDRLVLLAESSVATLSDAVHPSAAIVNLLPFLRHLPLELPIFAFQRLARETRNTLSEMRTVPYEFVKSSMAASGEGNYSFLAKLLDNHASTGGDKHQEELIKDVVATAYAAGADTSVSALVTFFLAMALHPEAQKRAQHELDTVIGKDRLPTYADRSDLPYVEAVFRETLRWSPVLPLGVFRAAYLDDIIDGYYIPKGSTVIYNVWSMTRNDRTYPDPESFKPERFLTEDGTCNEDEMLFPFGFGRRMCTGTHFARLTLWTAIASILLRLNIEQPEDEAGKPLKSLADINYSDGLVSHADRFRCVIKPRVA